MANRIKVGVIGTGAIATLRQALGAGAATPDIATQLGTYLAESGQPVTALSGVDSNGNGDSAGDRTILNPAGVGLTGTAVNFICNAGAGGATTVIADPSTCGSGNDANIVGYVAIDPAARFVQAGVGAKANVGRNTINTPGLNVWNMGLFKNTRITERFALQFRAETYDTFNHRNFSIGLPTNNGTIDQNTIASRGMGQTGWAATRLSVSHLAGASVTTGWPMPAWPIWANEHRVYVGPNRTYAPVTMPATALATAASRGSRVMRSARCARPAHRPRRRMPTLTGEDRRARTCHGASDRA